MLVKLSLVAALAACCVYSAAAEPAPFALCRNTDVIGRDIQVFVSGCNVTEACPLHRGTSHDFIVKFTPEEALTGGIERAIIGVFGGSGRAIGIEVPYGSAISAMNTTTRDSDSKTVREVGIESGTAYTHQDVFPVMRAAPATALRVRYVIREAVANVPRRQSRWNRHPGKKLACIEIPVQLV